MNNLSYTSLSKKILVSINFIISIQIYIWHRRHLNLSQEKMIKHEWENSLPVKSDDDRKTKNILWEEIQIVFENRQINLHQKLLKNRFQSQRIQLNFCRILKREFNLGEKSMNSINCFFKIFK